ncbi:hypothetical protein JCM10213v2_003771 [Rhodosporidiobolus nylandii]
MSANKSGQCCVCGKEARERCSACGKAGFDLFFCSREHQKLSWFAHKRVCGDKSNPFVFPLLTREEAEDAKLHLHVPTKITAFGQNPSLADMLVPPSAEYPKPLSLALSMIDAATEPGDENLDPEDKQLTLCLVHSARQARLSEQPAAVFNTFTALATFETFASEPLSDEPATILMEHWPSRLRHLGVVCFALSEVATSTAFLVKPDTDSLIYATKALVEAAVEALRSLAPQVVEDALHKAIFPDLS